jgi:hypothetical protein
MVKIDALRLFEQVPHRSQSLFTQHKRANVENVHRRLEGKVKRRQNYYVDKDWEDDRAQSSPGTELSETITTLHILN